MSPLMQVCTQTLSVMEFYCMPANTDAAFGISLLSCDEDPQSISFVAPALTSTSFTLESLLSFVPVSWDRAEESVSAIVTTATAPWKRIALTFPLLRSIDRTTSQNGGEKEISKDTDTSRENHFNADLRQTVRLLVFLFDTELLL